MFLSKLRRNGGSQSVLVPAAVLRDMGLHEGDDVEVEVRPVSDVPFDFAMSEMFDEYDAVFAALAER